MMRFGRRRKLTAEETAYNAAARAKRTKLAMHCQCCGRAILANTGVIAHHGYTRPDAGWQTASCMGARARPYENDRTKLGELLAMVEADIVKAVKLLAAIKAEKIEMPFSYIKYLPRVPGSWNTPKKEITIWMTRATYAESAANPEHEKALRYTDFDKIKEHYESRTASRLNGLRMMLTECKARYAAWKLTHLYVGGEWTAIDPKEAT
jgi:hypothetical protein